MTMLDKPTLDISAQQTTTQPVTPPAPRPYRPVFSVLATIIVVIGAVWLGVLAWNRYDTTPWTRDARVRVFAVAVAPEISGRIVEVDVHDNQAVRKGEVLMRIDPRDFVNALAEARAALAADQATAAMEGAKARVAQAELDVARTEVLSPVTGTITNLTLHAGDYAHAGQSALTVVAAKHIWITAYFEETELRRIRPGDVARVRLMAYPDRILTGHVQGIGRGISVADTENSAGGLPVVDPVYSWVRLTQRIPVHIAIDAVPDGVFLAAGMTATVRIVEPDRQKN
ncbi:MAG TPA: HlyD family secretion protein [Acidiphilium sp.]